MTKFRATQLYATAQGGAFVFCVLVTDQDPVNIFRLVKANKMAGPSGIAVPRQSGQSKVLKKEESSSE